MTSSRTLVFLVLVSFYGLTLLSLIAAAQSAAPGATLSPGAGASVANPEIPPAVRYRTVELGGLEPRLLNTSHFALEEKDAAVAGLARDSLASRARTSSWSS